VTATTGKLAGMCSVCLRTMQLHGDSPIRHGFSAIGVRQGQHSGYHTGPCQGTRFPHLGISTEGTQWALGNARTRLAAVNEELHRLAGNPDLTWYPTAPGSYSKVRGGLPDLSRPVVLRFGEKAAYSNDGRPTYAWEHKQRVAAQDRIKAELEKAIAAYEKVLASWSPDKYPATGAAAKVETVHMATPRRNSRGETWIGILCRFTRQGSASTLAKKTDDPSKVTCKRCRATLGLPPL
jgi:hypothetical protein